MVQFAKRAHCNHSAIVVCPAPNDRVEPMHDRQDVDALEREPVVTYLGADRLNRLLAGRDAEFVTRSCGSWCLVLPDGEPQKVEAFRQVDNAGLFG